MRSSLLKASPVQDLFKSFCQDEGVSCNDLLPEFRLRRAQEFYLTNDNHFNYDGETLAFELISRKLEELRLLPNVQATPRPFSLK